MQKQKNYWSTELNSEKSRIIIFSLAFVFNISLYLMLKFFFLRDLYLLSYDADLYDSIRNNGYDQEFLNAFFPSFPFLWKATGLGAFGISVLNLLLVYSSCFVLSKVYNWSLFQIISALFIPSAIIYFLPYSEGLFAVFSLMILIGYRINSTWLLIIGFFLANTCRPAATIFIPALVIVEVFSRRELMLKVKRITLFLSANLLGLLTVFLVQLSYGWPFFTSFKVQTMWGNQLRMPELPLKSWGGNWVTRLDGIALFLALVLLLWLARQFFKKKIYKIEPSKLFSILYVIGISLSVIIFRGGMLFSLNRFVFSTLFGLMALNEITRRQISLAQRAYLFLALSLFFFLFKSFNHIMNLVNFELAALLFVLLFGFKVENKIQKFLRPAVLLSIVVIYILSYEHILTGGWIG
jgi:hypothetical protein